MARFAYFAALWEAYPVQGHTYLSAAVVTQPAATLRGPLILDEAGQAAWLDPATPPKRCSSCCCSRARHCANGHWRVGQRSAPRFPECLTPA